MLGCRCRWDGRDKLDAALVGRIGSDAVAFCPEEAAGLGTPRPRASFQGGDGEAVWSGKARVLDEHGRDVTRDFKRGAARALAAALGAGLTSAVLKEGSPSCGTGWVEVEGVRVGGVGVTAALFARAGLMTAPA